MENTNFKKGDKVEYYNGTIKETFVVYSVGEHHLFSTPYNLPSYNKKYCKKVS